MGSGRSANQGSVSAGQLASGAFSLGFDQLEEGAKVTTPGRTITETDVVSFSALTGDWHPQHSDATWAAQSHFGERIAHGMMVVSYTVGLLPFEPDRVVALRGLRDVVFKRPVPIGETISAEAEVAAKKPLDEDHGLVTLAVKIKNADGKLLTRLAIDALWRRDAQPAVPASANGSVDAVADGRGGLDASGPTASGPDASAELSPVAGGRVLI